MTPAANTKSPAVNLPRVDASAITFVSRFYDVPLAGLVAFTGRVHFFALAPDAASLDGPLLVYPLTDAEIERELRCKQLFERHVGTWWSRDVPGSERRLVNCEGSGDYQTAVTAEFGMLDEVEIEAGYRRRDPVAVIVE